MSKLMQGQNMDFVVDDNLMVHVQRTDVGYVIDAYMTEPEEFITSMTVWDDDFDVIREEVKSILDTRENHEEEDF